MSRFLIKRCREFSRRGEFRTSVPGRLGLTTGAWQLAMVGLLGMTVLGGCQNDDEGLARQETPPPKAASTEEAMVSADENPLNTVRQSIAQRDLDGADAALRTHLLRNPKDIEALELAGDVAAYRGDRQASIGMYRESIAATASPPQRLFEKLAHESLAAGLAFDTIDVLSESLRRYPNQLKARYDLAGLATAVGLPRTTVPSLRWLSQHGRGEPESLILLADPDRAEPDSEMCLKLLQRVPEDRRPEYGLAKLDSQGKKWNEVLRRLEPIVAKYKDFVPAYLLYGRAAVELNDDDRVLRWKQTVPAGAELSSEYWLTAGLWAQKQGKHEQAARAIWESLRVDPVSQTETLVSLAYSLNQIGRPAAASFVADQIVKQSELSDSLQTHFERMSRSQSAALRVANAMVALGRLWEGEAWARLAVSLPNDPVSGIRDQYLAIRSRLTVETPWLLPERSIALQIDLSDLPIVEWAVVPKSPSAAPEFTEGRIRFAEQARERGWVHTCKIAPEAATQGHWIYQSVGGGVGVIDFDLDGWPDLAVAMLDGTPMQSDSSSNALFRNLGGVFADFTVPANYQDTGFSQGIAVGDFNEDGFPDIVDANIGQNRLFQNNGDGTFREIAQEAGVSGQTWTTSIAIADIDGDGIADLFETNYCRSPAPFEVVCRNEDGLIATCPPLKFDAEPDRVWQGKGDGTFSDVSQAWLGPASPGRGLGVVVGSFDERPGLDVYVANDMTVNHLWSGGSADNNFRMTDLGTIRGLGVNARSLSQASMGIAVGDPDQDGDTDFFLTHFSDDHNTYYEQISPGFWSDRSHVAGLAEPSQKLLGFGTQWCDFDNNGSLELIVANGHVDDLKQADIGYRMQPQLFQLDRSGHWIEQDHIPLGRYFTDTHLGRALVTLDADRDGRTDVAITHLYDPVALLINETEDGGSQITFELKATKGSRDAIGSVATMTVGPRKISAALTAGDGYMCSQQRRITVGTGTAVEVADMTVVWPSGTTQSFGTLQSGRNYLLVEGSDDAFALDDKE